jgi:hypothetical protein
MENYNKVINTEDILKKADIFLFLYDNSCQYSFSLIFEIQLSLLNMNLPCIYAKTKVELDEKTQIFSEKNDFKFKDVNSFFKFLNLPTSIHSISISSKPETKLLLLNDLGKLYIFKQSFMLYL